MADPFTLATVGIGATAGGSVLGGLGNMLSGQSSQNMYNYQSAVALVNKQISDQNASYAIAAGETSAQQSGMQTRATIGTTRATQGAGGLDVNSGSNLNVRSSEAEVGAESAALIRSNAAKQAYGYEVEGLQYTAQSAVYKQAGSQSALAGMIGAGSSLLGGAGSVASKWLGAQQAGIFSA